MKKNYKIELLNPEHDRHLFSCGVETLDDFLKTKAKQQAKKRLGATYVLLENNSPNIIGYYTLAATSIPLEALPETVLKKLPRYPSLPATLLGRLAINQSDQDKKLGSTLLYDALKRSFEFSERIGSVAVAVEVINKKAYLFYKKHGFVAFSEPHDNLFLPMATIKKLVLD